MLRLYIYVRVLVDMCQIGSDSKASREARQDERLEYAPVMKQGNYHST